MLPTQVNFQPNSWLDTNLFGINNGLSPDLSYKIDQILILLQGSSQIFDQHHEPIIQSLMNLRNNHDNGNYDSMYGFNPFHNDQAINTLNDIRNRIGGQVNEEPISTSLNRIHSEKRPDYMNNISNQIQQLHNATVQLVNQANDNSRLIHGIGTKMQTLDNLNELINNANALLTQTSNTHRNDIDQLIKENLLLRQNLENLISALKSSQ